MNYYYYWLKVSVAESLKKVDFLNLASGGGTKLVHNVIKIP